jgi:hypothetical protein
VHVPDAFTGSEHRGPGRLAPLSSTYAS